MKKDCISTFAFKFLFSISWPLTVVHFPPIWSKGTNNSLVKMLPIDLFTTFRSPDINFHLSPSLGGFGALLPICIPSRIFLKTWFQAQLPVRLPIARGTIGSFPCNITAYVITVTKDDFASCTPIIRNINTTFHAVPITIGMGPFHTNEYTIIIIHRRTEIDQPLGALAYCLLHRPCKNYWIICWCYKTTAWRLASVTSPQRCLSPCSHTETTTDVSSSFPGGPIRFDNPVSWF